MCEESYDDLYERLKTNTSSPTLVLAGPGAGKTHLIADRIEWLIRNQGIPKERITVLTFGKDASLDMERKITDPNGNWRLTQDEKPEIKTINGYALSLVKEHASKIGLRNTLRVQPDNKIRELIFKDACYLAGLDERCYREALKCKGFGDCDLNEENDKCKVCAKYLEIMKKCNYIDFDDQILFACRILEENPDILEAHQESCEYLLVDEYQDINAAQHKFIKLLSGRNPNGLFVVGDDAQSIYGFRGASPDFILNFEKHYEGAIKESLPRSWRCPKCIMEPSFSIIQEHYEEWAGSPYTEYAEEDTEAPIVYQMRSGKTEAKMVAIIAKEGINAGKKVLVLAPKDAYFFEVMNYLDNYSIPHECPVGLIPKRICILKDFLDWIREQQDNFSTRIVLEHLINTGPNKVAGAGRTASTKPETIEHRIECEKKIACLWDNVSMRNKLINVIIDSDDDFISSIAGTLNCLIEAYNTQSRTLKGEFIKRIAIAMGKWIDPQEIIKDIDSIHNLLNKETPVAKGVVQLKSMRKSKGLEADIVIIIGLEDDAIPKDETDLDEKARLFYVAMTRAKEMLFLFHAFKRSRGITYGQELRDKNRSRFLDILGIKSEWKNISP